MEEDTSDHNRRRNHSRPRNEGKNWRNSQNRQEQSRGRGPRQPYRGVKRGQSNYGCETNIHAINLRQNNINRGDNNAHRRDGRSSHGNENDKVIKVMGFKTLEELTHVNARDILEQINQRKDAFLNLLKSPIENTDIFVLVIHLLSKICQSSFDELKLRYLLEVCNSPFIQNLRNCLIDLPYTQRQFKNRLYWDDPNTFWQNFILFCECILNMAPSVALKKCRTLIEASSKCCLDAMRDRHCFNLSVENNDKLNELRERLLLFEKTEEEKSQRRPHNAMTDDKDEEPPEDFRLLSVVPSREELVDNMRPFLRANVVRGGYQDIDHYLDVQFRLLREDCFGPLRHGLLQYMDTPNQKKYDNIRVYNNVEYIQPYVTKTKVGLVVQLDKNSMKRFKSINWLHSKRFIFGSLLLFTNDHCRSFVTATILDRDIKYISQGKLPISIIETHGSSNELMKNQAYVMIESEVYFEPYQHVLKALQDPRFPDHLAMSKYIVKVDPVPRPPQYVDVTTAYNVETEYGITKFNVLQLETWPSCNDMCMDESQYEAYKLALTNEFAVIQGPPGTGKTYLGVKVANTLLSNMNSVNKGCLMLIICYTNHALDQFLEHILTITNSVVRIGGQSRNPAMEAISLNNLRRSKHSRNNSPAHNLFYNERNRLRMIMAELQNAQKRIESLSDGILAYSSIQGYIPEAKVLLQYYSLDRGDIIKEWLFEKMPYREVNQNLLHADKIDDDDESLLDFDYEKEQRTNVLLDDFMDIDEQEIYGVEVKTSFMLYDMKQKLKQLISCFKRSDSQRGKQQFLIEMQELNSRIICFKEMQEAYHINGVPREMRAGENLSRLSHVDRWFLYFTWAGIAINKIKEEIKPLQQEINSSINAYEEARMNLDLKVIERIKVIGMTTSGAARLRKLLQALQPPIVIVEEAAEVLEQHIVTSLTKGCQHLILIGDHQQLRPSASYMKLARHYNIEVSLFERMILNDMHSRRLNVQHRMRPEIAALISPHIYTNLVNHVSVDAFPHVRGITSNLFFFSHDYKEEPVEDSSSRLNQKEADMVLCLANYIMQQGYNSDDVTILTPYTGQMFYMKKQQSRYSFLAKVKITIVDNYQGEESKIILLSLVRNNNENKIGFLGTANRICVALSRAKEGFYIFGNIDTLKINSPLWTNIAKTLEEQACLGASLMLKCENHENQISLITNIKDFEKVPEGGCLLKCNYNLPECGHRCPQICHGYDRGHSTTKCQLACEREICELRHVCPLKCSVKCEPCKRFVTKMLPCEHKKEVFCHLDPSDPTIKCNISVAVRLPNCNHEAKKPCHMNLKSVICIVRCVYRIESCGHMCRRRCHVTDDPDHEKVSCNYSGKLINLKYSCDKPCTKAKKNCTANLSVDRGDHQCQKKCYESCDECNVEVIKKRSKCTHSERVACCKDVDEKKCSRNCNRSLPCGHFCKKKCFEPCGDCNQKVKKPLPDCNHTIEIACKEVPTRNMCRQPCERTLSCGHRCKERCDKICDANRCIEITTRLFTSPCGHKVQLPCNQLMKLETEVNTKKEMESTLLSHCNEPCNKMLKCEHMCRGTCSKCHQGRIHAPCTQKCQVIMICGHQCEEPCNHMCPPCKKPCELKCPHSQCSKLCGAPCVMCQEKCHRKCRHGACNQLCGQRCAPGMGACDERCPLRLPCGHPCRGLCGEPCPDICNICRPDTFPKDFLGDDYDDDMTFIKLQDCSHILAVEDADNLMQGDTETVKIRTCPFCRKPIINTYRYKDLVNDLYKNEINPIKERVYGTPEQVTVKRVELIEALANFKGINKVIIYENDSINMVYESLQLILKRQKKVSVLQVKMHLQQVNVLNMLAIYYKKYKSDELTLLKDEFLYQIKIISVVLRDNIYKISQQQQEDIGNEMKRLNSIIQLSKILSHPVYLSNQSLPKIQQTVKEAKEEVISYNIYKEDNAIIKLKTLQECVKLHGIVTKEERNLIVQAIGLKQGHWFKCPNGHFYCIGECGGAMQVSKCIECGAVVGGQNHRLLSSNTLAREMDGASYAAWSEEYNNMANFDLNL